MPYGMAVHNNEEIKAVTKTLHSSTQMGKNVYLFEKKISKLFDKKYGLMVNSGSSALFLTFSSINFPRGTEVITPVLTFATTVAAMVQNDLIPVFIDVKKTTFCIDENNIEKMISKKTKAICIPNLIGNIPNWIIINKIARKYNLLIIEDSADALGSKIRKKSTGLYSDISITSFYGSHIINCAGNGGLVCFNNIKYYIRNIENGIRLPRNYHDETCKMKSLEKEIELEIQYLPIVLEMQERFQSWKNNVNKPVLKYFTDKYSKEFKRCCKAVGIDRRFHDLRHTFAVRRYLMTRDIYQVMKEMGHSKISTTEIYSKFNDRRLETDFPILAGMYNKTAKIGGNGYTLMDTKVIYSS